ncbi:hypothetical protein AMES_2793 [Amycolatopsis mediterranei S699]|uniref:Uncharacterized protein n=2 Tax=Amycolatopsis mediterranei TaxID=33910 RepID=A0A0H3D336_AMYMU|nr:hypothetical protein AMED_2822 [Amycolatopsis mediterranei U32]AEK41356.1 hypothetical protein RAM_14340 [Amycolatopsis mediterranei S699]AGT83458.1 hypothetical protein B737_2794 [Amycolatopsis mediterranei RB]KDO07026.1 hypothetical protein DV26_30200 [Amycolatopsis mediterranei]AFO76329.1 hypothetical protein AMES_2793 [Amycolatopsis mediterranei S699]
MRRAAESSATGSGTSLGCLVDPTASLPGATPASRAWAIWGLLVDEIDKLGSVVEPREHFVLLAAFRLPPVPAGSANWAGTLQDRFRQLAKVRGLFGSREPLSNTPMNKAWAGALEMLSAAVARKLGRIAGAGWLPYVGIGQSATVGTLPGNKGTEGFRAPSEGAQPVFMKRMIVTVVMHRKTALRRITERHIVACEDGVDGYDVHALTGWSGNLADIPVTALWNCRLDVLPGRYPNEPSTARLCFGRKLRSNDSHEFSSEAVDVNLDEERKWINVKIDHHGVREAGLTIRVAFDAECLPEACWWYAEQLEVERLRRPPAGSSRLLDVGNGFVQHTFEACCHPREEYGIAFSWPRG